MKNMKKIFIFLTFILSIFFSMNVVKAESLDIKITDVKILEKGGTITAEDPVITGDEVTSELSFNQKDDYVIFEYTLLNNETDKYKIKSIEDNNKNNSLEITYDYDKELFTGEKKIKVKMLYKTSEINKIINVSDLTIKINLEAEDGSSSEIIINPITGDNILEFLFLLIIAVSILIIIKKKVNIKGIKLGLIAIVMMTLFIPIAALAVNKFEIKIKFTNVTIVGVYENYDISIDPENGDQPEIRNITYGEKIGDLPAAPSKTGYTFSKWVDQNGNEVTKDTVITGPTSISASYDAVEYDITYDLDGGTATNPSKYTIEDEITLNNPTKAGYTFTGWTGSNGETPEETVTISNSIAALNYVAHYEVNELDFNGNDTISKIYSDTAQSFTIEEASNGSGNYTYEITDGNTDNYFSISGTTVTVKENIPAGEYTIKITASDSTTGASKEATYVVTITKKQSEKVTNLNIKPNGEVEFTNSSDSDGYLISIDGTNYTPVVPGSETTTYDFLNEITAASGTRTVYVKSTNSDSGNYGESDPVTANVTVYVLSVTLNDDDYGTVSESSVNVISGATYETNNSTLTLSDGRTITTSKKDAEGYKTTFTGWSSESGTITQDVTVTATYTREESYAKLTINSNGGSITETEGWTIVGETATKDIKVNAVIGTLPEVTNSGYILAGWNTSEDGTGDDVTEATVITEDLAIYAQWIEAQSTFLSGFNVNAKIKTLAAGSQRYYYHSDNIIKSFKRSTTKPDIEAMDNKNILSTDDSIAPIYGWLDDTDGTLYYWTEDINPKLNSDGTSFFAYLNGITSIDLNSIDTSNVRYMNNMFEHCNSLTSLVLGDDFDTSNVTEMIGMFVGCSSLTSLDLGDNFDTGNVTNMIGMFVGCSSLTSLDLGDNFDTSSVTKMSRMFQNCSSLTSLDLGDNFDTGNVTNMDSMFQNCSSLTSLDLSSFDTSNVANMSYMLDGCSDLSKLDISDFDMRKVTDSYRMLPSNIEEIDATNTKYNNNTSTIYKDKRNLKTLNLENADTSNVTNMSDMFLNCDSLISLDLSSFDTSNVTNMSYMFYSCDNLETIYASTSFNTHEVTNDDHMFAGDGKLVGGKGTTYDANYIDSTRAHIDKGSFDPGYFTAGLPEHSVTFNPTGGTVNVESKSVSEGKSIGVMPIAEKDGMDFAGWYTRTVEGEKVTEETVINNNTTLYAHWIQSDFISFIDNNHNDIVDAGDEVSIGADEFYVIGSGSEVKLLAKYNLDANYRQSKYGSIKESFSSSCYWCEESSSDTSSSSGEYSFVLTTDFSTDSYSGYYYIYRDNNNNDKDNNLYTYLNNYKDHLINDKGIEGIIDVRLPSYSDIDNNNNYEDYIIDRNYWLGSTPAHISSSYNYDTEQYSYYLSDGELVYSINKGINGITYDSYYNSGNGIRPMVIINEKKLLEEYTVTFDTDGGSSVSPQNVYHGKTLTNWPTNPTKSNRKFMGWYTDPEFTDEFTRNSQVTRNLTLYAKFVDWCKTFETDSWSTIESRIEQDPSYYGYGCEKNVNIDMDDNGTPETYKVRIANTSRPEECDTEGYSQTACGVVIEFVNIVANKKLYSSNWSQIELATWLNTDFYDKLPSDLKSLIIPTYPIKSNIQAPFDIIDKGDSNNKIYLPSYGDLTGYGYEGRKLDYYGDKYGDYTYIKQDIENNAVAWWTRSADSGNNLGRRRYVTTSGDLAQRSNNYTNTYGVAPAFRIGSPMYNVTFETNGGTNITKQVIKSGGNATRPGTTPEKRNNEFVDWYTDDTYTTVFDFENTTITDDITIYAKYINYCESFENDDWNTIVSNINANSNYYPIACEKEVEMDMDGDETPESYTVRLANTSTPEVCNTEGYSQTACGTVIEFVDVVTTHKMNSSSTNAGGWKSTEMVTWLNSDFYNKLPNDLQAVIIPTYPIVSGSGSGGSSPNITEEDSTINKIYLLSGREVGLDLSYDNKRNVTTDTRTLDYYSTYNDYNSRVKRNLSGSAYSWWLRSAKSNYGNRFFNIWSGGGDNDSLATSSTGVAPAFRIQ